MEGAFSGGRTTGLPEAFALAIRELPYVTIIGDRTNGIFSYQLEKKLPNGWRYCLSYPATLLVPIKYCPTPFTNTKWPTA